MANNDRRNETRNKSDPKTNQTLGYPRVNIHSGICWRSFFVVWVRMMECEANMGSKTTVDSAERGMRMECMSLVWPRITRQIFAAILDVQLLLIPSAGTACTFPQLSGAAWCGEASAHARLPLQHRFAEYDLAFRQLKNTQRPLL